MHPSMPQEPLVILHCALQQGPASSMNDILHPHQLQLAHPDAVGEPHCLWFSVAEALQTTPGTANLLHGAFRLQSGCKVSIFVHMVQSSLAIMYHHMLCPLKELMITSTAASTAQRSIAAAPLSFTWTKVQEQNW